MDGDLAFNEAVRINIPDSRDVLYSDDTSKYDVPGINGSVTNVAVTGGPPGTNPIITFRASTGGISSGTEVNIVVSGVDTSTNNVENTVVSVDFTREDTAPNQTATTTFEVGIYTEPHVVGATGTQADTTNASRSQTNTEELVITAVGNLAGAVGNQVTVEFVATDDDLTATFDSNTFTLTVDLKDSTTADNTTNNIIDEINTLADFDTTGSGAGGTVWAVGDYTDGLMTGGEDTITIRVEFNVDVDTATSETTGNYALDLDGDDAADLSPADGASQNPDSDGSDNIVDVEFVIDDIGNSLDVGTSQLEVKDVEDEYGNVIDTVWVVVN